MLLGEAALGAVAGAKSLWGYNRSNYLYDRTMRQKTEFKILEFRRAQAEMWREDVRDITSLTERKMDNYLIVNAIMLTMCLGLYAEGKLDPGTPPWLVHLYMLTLGAAFVYLLMSVWFAMHASIIAQCTSVRLLTQFVRIPIPTWEELEEARTYGSSFEAVTPSHMFRLPFTGPRPSACEEPPRSPPMPFSAKSPRAAAAAPRQRELRRPGSAADPWELERHGAERMIYELQAMPASLRRHIGLARRAAMQYQCFDAFARVAMSFGTNQLLYAVSYFALGYVGHQGRSPSAAWCAVAALLVLSSALVQLDLSLTWAERLLARVLMVGGPVCVAFVGLVSALAGNRAEVTMLIYSAYFFHGAWLFFFMRLCGIELLANGLYLPLKFRAVLYLDVFGWLSTSPFGVRGARDGVSAFASTTHGPKPDLFLRQCSDGLFTRQYSHEELNARELGGQAALAARSLSASGEVFAPPARAFTNSSFAPCSSKAPPRGEPAHEVDQPGRAPAKVFRITTAVLIALWALGSAVPGGGAWGKKVWRLVPSPARCAFLAPGRCPHLGAAAAALRVHEPSPPAPPANAARSDRAGRTAGVPVSRSLAALACLGTAAPRRRQRARS